MSDIDLTPASQLNRAGRRGAIKFDRGAGQRQLKKQAVEQRKETNKAIQTRVRKQQSSAHTRAVQRKTK